MEPRAKKKKPSDAEQVSHYMEQLEHPLKAEIEAVRAIIKAADSRLSERIKWNAPSYYSKADLLTFHIQRAKNVHLVFHHPAIVQIQSNMLEGDYKDRRMVYFNSMEEINAGKKELENILKTYIDLADNGS